jgi:hypothetical protein
MEGAKQVVLRCHVKTAVAELAQSSGRRVEIRSITLPTENLRNFRYVTTSARRQRLLGQAAGSSSLGQANAFGTGTLGATADFVTDLLSFVQFVVGDALNGGAVEKQVVARPVFNETKTFIRDPLDRTVCHGIFPSHADCVLDDKDDIPLCLLVEPAVNACLVMLPASYSISSESLSSSWAISGSG